MSHDKSSPDFLYHHFYDVDQQYETSKLGMWAFILTEILTFGALFVAYTIYRAWNPDMFIGANLLLQTIILIEINKKINYTSKYSFPIEV